jgi:hypothetical protein
MDEVQKPTSFICNHHYQNPLDVTHVSFIVACSNILCFVWQFYVASFAHSAVKDYILGVIHGSLLSLPWDRFWPSVQDLEHMIKVQELPHLACKT